MPVSIPLLVLAALGLAACEPRPYPEAEPVTSPDTTLSPAFVGSWWRLQTLGGTPPAEGVRPVLIFTDLPAERDTYDRPYPAQYAGWKIVNGESGVGHLHAPYWLDADSLQFAETYDYTRLSTAEEETQAKQFAEALARTQTFEQQERQLILFDEGRDTLATFSADLPRSSGPLDDIEWTLAEIGGAPTPQGTRATLTFSSDRLGPGPDDGFDSFGGYSGCNWYGGGYTLQPEDGGRYKLITNGHVISTQRGCPPPASEVEEAVQDALYRTAHVQVAEDDPDRLALLDSSGAEMLVFRRHVPYPVDLDALRRGRWHFRPTAEDPSVDPVEVTFADSTFEASVGCFRVEGTYHVEGDNIWVPSSRGDAGACDEDELSRPHALPLSSGKLSVSDEQLTLYDENGSASQLTRPQ